MDSATPFPARPPTTAPTAAPTTVPTGPATVPVAAPAAAPPSAAPIPVPTGWAPGAPLKGSRLASVELVLVSVFMWMVLVLSIETPRSASREPLSATDVPARRTASRAARHGTTWLGAVLRWGVACSATELDALRYRRTAPRLKGTHGKNRRRRLHRPAPPAGEPDRRRARRAGRLCARRGTHALDGPHHRLAAAPRQRRVCRDGAA